MKAHPFSRLSTERGSSKVMPEELMADLSEMQNEMGGEEEYDDIYKCSKPVYLQEWHTSHSLNESVFRNSVASRTREAIVPCT